MKFTFVGQLKTKLEDAGATFTKLNEGGRFFWECRYEGIAVASHRQLGPCIRQAAKELGEQNA